MLVDLAVNTFTAQQPVVRTEVLAVKGQVVEAGEYESSPLRSKRLLPGANATHKVSTTELALKPFIPTNDWKLETDLLLTIKPYCALD